MLNFIRVKDYIIKVDDICYIKEAGCGCHIACKFGTIDITNLEEGELECIYAKLNETQELEPVMCTTTKEEVHAPEIQCIWSHCRMCTHFCQTTDYAIWPGIVKVRCGKYGFKDEIGAEFVDTFGPDDWRTR